MLSVETLSRIYVEGALLLAMVQILHPLHCGVKSICDEDHEVYVVMEAFTNG